MSTIQLPVSQTAVELRAPTGADDLLLLEMTGDPVEITVAWLERLARRADGTLLAARHLPFTDLQWLLLEQRRGLLGDEIVAKSRCAGPGCGARTDISFSIADYLGHHRPRRPKHVDPAETKGWVRLRGSSLEFRPPTAADVVAARRTSNPDRELAVRTVRPGNVSGPELKRVQRAMEGLAPCLADEVEGRCPECGMVGRFWFDVDQYVQRELRFEAEWLYEDVNLLARRYHWPEEKILALPRVRRVHYAELAMRGVN
jgi:hypothetical protein